jgi:hypothetical protein
VEKIARNELFALLARAPVTPPTVPDPDQPPPVEQDSEEWAEGLAAQPTAREILKATAILPEPAPTIRTASPTARPSGRYTPSTGSDQQRLQRLLDKSVPRLWQYALKEIPSRDPTHLRQKLRELLVWLFEKEGFDVRQQAAAPYRVNNREVKGRVDLVIHRKGGAPLLAMEADWTRTAASVLKLGSWSRQGIPVVWIIGAATEPTVLSSWRRFADEVSDSRSSRWLPILHLEHGWVSA